MKTETHGKSFNLYILTKEGTERTLVNIVGINRGTNEMKVVVEQCTQLLGRWVHNPSVMRQIVTEWNDPEWQKGSEYFHFWGEYQAQWFCDKVAELIYI